MAFCNGCGIDLKTITELAAQGLSLNSMSKVTGHSKNGIKAALERNDIPYTMGIRERFVTVDGVLMSLGDACNAQGFSRDTMYAWRVKRGLNEQDGFEAYIVYQQSKRTIDKPILKNTCGKCLENVESTNSDAPNEILLPLWLPINTNYDAREHALKARFPMQTN